jgi:hypothetical protein
VIDLSKVAEKLRTVVLRFRVGQVGRDVLKTALAMHSAWTGRLKTAIASGRLDTPIGTIRADDQCQFGKWLHGESLSDEEKCGEHYVAVKHLHAQFHQAASKVAQLAISGQRGDAERAMGQAGEYTRVSADLTAAINRWMAAV